MEERVAARLQFRGTAARVMPSHQPIHTMIQTFRVSLLASALVIVCGPGIAAAQAPAAAPDAKPAATAPAAAEDRSLTAKEAEAMKFPPFDRTWKGEDFTAATELLSRIGTLDAAQLPHSGSTRSGELFARLTTTKNFAFNDAAAEVKTWMPEALQQLQSLNRLGEVYRSASDRKFVSPTNYLELYGTVVQAARGVMLGLDEYSASLDEKDPATPVRKEGLVTLKVVIGDMINNVISALGNEELSTAERRRLIESVRPSLPEVMSKLPEARRQQLLLRFRFFAFNTEPKELQSELQKLAEEITKALPPAP